MEPKTVAFEVAGEEALHVKTGTIQELSIHVDLTTEYENGPPTTSQYNVTFNRTDDGFRWGRVKSPNKDRSFGNHHCLIVLEAASYIEEHYDAEVSTGAISRGDGA